jgi:uncharacterized protein YhaN
MSVRIKGIKINRDGPLEDHFDMVPTDLNLVYGANETGKTYIVEAMIRFLFRAGSWRERRRCWEPNGRLILSGIKSEPVSFTRTKRKLEDYWKEDNLGLPQDFSRLLVVRAGETNLSESPDGVGMDILKHYLSSQGILDTMENRISQTITNAYVEDQIIKGGKVGEIGRRKNVHEDLKRIDHLIEDVNRNFVAGAIQSLRIEGDRKKANVEELNKAKRHHAAQVDNDRKTKQKSLKDFPDNDYLGSIEGKIGAYGTMKANKEQKENRLKVLKKSSADYNWAQKALNIYQDIMSRRQTGKYGAVFMVLTGISFAAAVTLGLLGQKLGLGLGAAAALLFFGFYWWDKSRYQEFDAADRAELENLKQEFQNRFKENLSDKAALEAKLTQLNQDHIQAGVIRNELNEIESSIEITRAEINRMFGNYVKKDIPPGHWQEELKHLREQRNSIQNEINNLDTRIAALGIPEEQFLYKYPGLAWDPDRYAQVEKEIANLRQEHEGSLKTLDSLKARVAQETDRDITARWEDLLSSLYEKRDDIAREYRDITAEILAKIQLYSVIKDRRTKEILRIKEGLEHKYLIDTLLHITKRYNHISLDDGSLTISDREDESFRLADMSTGVREQVFLALRLGFASIAMEGKTGFLILDDAFQHSDWGRRENLIQQTLDLIHAGWQVFYFTMDKHIQRLFNEAGERLGDGFQSIELK